MKQNKSGRGGKTGIALARAAVRYRYVVFLLFAAALIFCGASVGRTRTNSDLAVFLPDGCETKRGAAIMSDEFRTYASARILISNTGYRTAAEIAKEISGMPRVLSVEFDDTPSHLKGSDALISVSFSGGTADPAVIGAMDEITGLLDGLDFCIDTDVGTDYNSQIASEMTGVLLLSSAVILVVLTLTSRSFFEPAVYAVVFASAAVLNMGTNFLLGAISTISNSIAVVMQLALAIDYSIIFMHRYQSAAADDPDPREAAAKALAGAVPEILSSGLTTVTGLVALTLMKFRLGYDLGIVLTKGILISMLTVFLLMPGLTVLSARPLAAAAHKQLFRGKGRAGAAIYRFRFVFAIVFALLIPAGIILSGRAPFAFTTAAIDAVAGSDEALAEKKINSTFERSTTTAVLVPAGDPARERELMSEIEKLDGTLSVLGYAGIETGKGHCVTDRLTAAEFASVAGLDDASALAVYAAYAARTGSLGSLAGGGLTATLPEILDFLLGDAGSGLLPSSAGESLSAVREKIASAEDQLVGEKFDRIIVTSDHDAESADGAAYAEEIRNIADGLWSEGSTVIAGDITLARDLIDTHEYDSVLVGTLTAGFVFLILLFTFRTPVGAAILVFVIQSCIWINFSIPALTGTRSFFVTYMIVSAIQMGATIDYAIVMMNRYRTLRQTRDRAGAAVRAVREAFPTIVTSGSILGAAGLLIGYRVSDVFVGHIGLAVGRGAVISVIIVTTVLPGLLAIFDKAISLTTIRAPRRMRKETDCNE